MPVGAARLKYGHDEGNAESDIKAFPERAFQLEDFLSWLGIWVSLFSNVSESGYQWYAAYDQKSSNWKVVLDEFHFVWLEIKLI